jgi:hypothetical protein
MCVSPVVALRDARERSQTNGDAPRKRTSGSPGWQIERQQD